MDSPHPGGVLSERVLAGRNNLWFLGPGGVARLDQRHLAPNGTLLPPAERKLRDSGLYTSVSPSAYSLTVLTSTDCNLGCGYCFQNTGQDAKGGNRPPRIAHSRLNSAGITTILEFARKQMAAAALEKLSLTLFGGEPLLNPRGCVELLTRAADYGMVTAGMISNATLLTPRLAGQLSAAGLRSVQVTFDGDRDTHDQIRVRRSNGGTFDAIVANLARASQDTTLKWILRVNVSQHSYPGIDALIGQLAEKLDTSKCVIYFAMVGDVGIGYDNSLQYNDQLISDFSRWHKLALDLGFSVPRPHAYVPCQTCGHGNGRLGAVVNADGTLTSCWETAGKPGWEVGTASDGFLPDEEISGKWTQCEDFYRRFGDDEPSLVAFRDAVDASLLDYLSETGRL